MTTLSILIIVTIIVAIVAKFLADVWTFAKYKREPDEATLVTGVVCFLLSPALCLVAVWALLVIAKRDWLALVIREKWAAWKTRPINSTCREVTPRRRLQ